MNHQTSDIPTIMESSIFGLITRPLGNALSIARPFKAEHAPNAFPFGRSRMILVKWDEVFSAAALACRWFGRPAAKASAC